jgi:maltose alpha-D-glucosyltransferase/alpha-amylase
VFGREYATPEYQNLASRDLAIKFYRRLDVQATPDLEVRRLLDARAFAHAARLLGSAHYRPDAKATATIAIYESRLSIQGSGYQYVLDNLSRYTESVVLAMDDPNAPQNGEQVELLDTIRYVEMPREVQAYLDSTFVSRIANLGRTVAAYHQLLSDATTPGFGTEALSLHYQRSLFAGLKGKVRETMTLLKRTTENLPEADRPFAERLRTHEAAILDKIKPVFDHKIEADKIRIHGDMTLEQFALTGDDFTFLNFDGDPELPFSQRRLRRSAVKDLANLLRSLHYAAMTAERQAGQLREDRSQKLRKQTELVYRCVAAEFLTAYRKAVAGTRLLPADEADIERLLTTFLIEKGLQEVRYDLLNRPDQAIIPIRAVLDMIDA